MMCTTAVLLGSWWCKSGWRWNKIEYLLSLAMRLSIQTLTVESGYLETIPRHISLCLLGDDRVDLYSLF
jgi:hypothetical protein